ncbi:MAG: O-antigen ligase family protein [bacterium]|nr:O-antigen ligase family protein [bacterium]
MQQSKTPQITGYIFALFIAIIPFIKLDSIADPTLLSRQIYLSMVLLFGLAIIIYHGLSEASQAKQSKSSQVKQSNTSEVKQSEPSQVKQSEPSQVTLSKPSQATKSEPSQVTLSKPSQATKSEPSQVTLSKPSQATKSEPSQVTPYNPSQFIIRKPSWVILSISLIWVLSALPSFSELVLDHSRNFSETWYSVSKTAFYVSAIWICYALVRTEILSVKHISVGVVLASIIALVLLALEIVEKQVAGTQLWSAKNLYELQSPFGHKNLYASFQLLCLPFFVYLFLLTKKYLRFMVAFAFLAAFSSIGLIQTKSVLLGLFLSTALSLPIAILLLFKPYRKQIYLVLSLVFVGLIVGVFYVYQHPQQFTLLLNNDTIRERIFLWQNTVEMIQEHFPYGVGAGEWQVYFPKYGLANFYDTNYLISDGYTTFQRPHSDFLWVLSELGLFGFLAYVGVFAYFIFYGIKQLHRAIETSEKIWRLSFLLVLFAYMFVAMVDFPLERNEHQFILALLLSSLIGSDRKNAENAAEKSGIWWIPALLLLPSLAFALMRLPNEQHSKQVVLAQARGDWQRILKETNKIDSNVYSLDNFSIPIAWYEGLAHYSLNEHEAAKLCFERAYRLNPYQVHVLNNMAGMQEQEGNHELALKYYDELLAISPKQPDAILNKSAVLFNQKKNVLAMACLYQFKYDATNEQYLQFLDIIGKAYLREDLDKLPLAQKKTPLLNIEDPAFVRRYFQWNKEQRHDFKDLKWPN